MTRKHLIIAMLYMLLSLTLVPSAFAQSTTDIEFSDIVDALGPRTGTDLILDIFLYLIFFFGLINMFLISDKQLLPTMLNFTVMGLAIVSKLLVGREPGIEATAFAVLVLNVGIFVIPLIMAGMLRANKGKAPPAMPSSILMGLLGGGYFFMFWFFEQRGT